MSDLEVNQFKLNYEFDDFLRWIKVSVKISGQPHLEGYLKLLLDAERIWERPVPPNETLNFTLDRKLFKVPSPDYRFLVYFDGKRQEFPLDMSQTLYELIQEKRDAKENSAEDEWKNNEANVMYELRYNSPRRITEGQLRQKRQLLLPKLEDYLPDQGLLKLFTDDFKIKDAFRDLTRLEYDRYKQLIRFCKKGVLHVENYTEILKMLVEIEDLCVNSVLYTFRIPKIAVNRSETAYFIDISGLDNFPTCIEEGDYILLKEIKLASVNSAYRPDSPDELTCTITKISGPQVEFALERDSRIRASLWHGQAQRPYQRIIYYSVCFRKDRTCFQMEQKALHQVEPETIKSILFPESYGTDPQESFNFVWFNHAVSENFEQQQAIKNIVSGTAFPAPYIIFGPPGTGKTSTIVETICQIWKHKPTANILVTAPSNAACDEIAERLLKYLPADDLYRYYSKSFRRNVRDLDQELLMISNFAKGGFKQPRMELIKKYRITLSTVVQAGRFDLNGLEKNHFQYIFLDECGSSTEPSSLIPIAGLISLKEEGKTNVILAGDPKQLGPVVTCELANFVGLGLSLLERLMNFEFYQPQCGTYNEKIITKLLLNFRSHPAILKAPSDLFYDGQLIAKARPQITDFALNWKLLPNKTLPMIFHAVEGQTKSNSNSFSFYNDEEITEICRYITEITKYGINGQEIPLTEIGVVSPYALQCQKIKMTLKDKFKRGHEIQVGSAEQYQGKEKMVMILSTVRSNTKTAGFLGDPKRLNVVITRAKGLMIIIGNPKTLSLDMNWFKLIQYCKENGATKGAEFELKKPAANQVDVHGNAIQTYEEKFKESLSDIVERFANFVPIEASNENSILSI